MDRITVKLLDGREETFETSTYMALADRVAYERRFHESAAKLAGLGALFDDKGNPLEGADLSDLREEGIAFLTWRVCKRDKPELAPAGFEEFLELLEELTIEPVKAEGEEAEAEDPTEPPSA